MIEGFISDAGTNVPFTELEDRLSEFPNWPIAVLRSMVRQKKTYCDYSVTELTSPPQVVQLRRRFSVFVRPSDLVWSTFGTAYHLMLETKDHKGITEEKMLLYYSWSGNELHRTHPDDAAPHEKVWAIGGISDHYEPSNGGTLTNYKVTSTYKAKMAHAAKETGDYTPIIDWVMNENFYAYMWREHGLPVNRLQICMFLRDWSAREAEQKTYLCTRCNKNHMETSKIGQEHAGYASEARKWYPEHQIYLVDLPVWAHNDAAEKLEERIAIHLKAAETSNNAELPQCSLGDTWNGLRCKRYCEVACHCEQNNAVVQNG